MRRIVKPPGGESSDIFGVSGDSPLSEMLTPRKTNNYMQSNIFTPDSTDSGMSPSPSPSPNGHTPTTPTSKQLDTQNRLFGDLGDPATPRRVVNRQRSSIFEDEVVDSRPKSTPVRRLEMNPITGTPSAPSTPNGGSPPNGINFKNGMNGTNGVKGQNGVNLSNGINGTNGFDGINGHVNGYTNGHSSPVSPMNGSPRVRNPPGGKSSGIF